MAIGVETAWSSRAGIRAAGAGPGTIREVCLIGMDADAPPERWTTGQEVTWQGRGYRIMAAATARHVDGTSGPAPASRYYVHLAPCDVD